MVYETDECIQTSRKGISVDMVQVHIDVLPPSSELLIAL